MGEVKEEERARSVGGDGRAEREERAKKPIIRENTAGCHPQDSPETIGRRFVVVILFHSVVAPFKRETASPFRDFMTNLFNDRGTIYGRTVTLKLPTKIRLSAIISRYGNSEYLFMFQIIRAVC